MRHRWRWCAADFALAPAIGIAAFAGLVFALYRWALSASAA